MDQCARLICKARVIGSKRGMNVCDQLRVEGRPGLLLCLVILAHALELFESISEISLFKGFSRLRLVCPGHHHGILVAFCQPCEFTGEFARSYQIRAAVRCTPQTQQDEKELCRIPQLFRDFTGAGVGYQLGIGPKAGGNLIGVGNG